MTEMERARQLVEDARRLARRIEALSARNRQWQVDRIMAALNGDEWPRTFDDFVTDAESMLRCADIAERAGHSR